ncbi:hypothetical protein B0H14DRAFT_2689784 [Mycena olivaceomarginata]|nr:hypothetical protein B0H14DRAFT_2689784 [Mycena olivaceomarginata]
MSQETPQGLVVTTALEGLVFVYLEPGPVSEADLNDWYDNEHAPLKLTVPGVKSAIRYKAVDSQTPTWLALYGVDTPEVAKSEPYNALQARASDKEKAILEKVEGLSRRTYVHTATFTHPDTPAESLPCKFLLVVTLEMPNPEQEDDLNKWYDEEHMDLLSKIPGWKQGRRYKLIDFNQLKGLADKPFKHATSTEWRERVMKNAGRKARVFELYRKF